MSHPTPPPYSWRQFFDDFGIGAGFVSAVIAVLSGVFWLFNLFPLIAGAIFFLGLGGSLVGFIGHQAVSSRQSFVALGDLRSEEPKPLPSKPLPRSNLQLAGIEHLNLWADDDEVYWEIQKDGGRQEYPSYSALLRFSNEPVLGVRDNRFATYARDYYFETRSLGNRSPLSIVEFGLEKSTTQLILRWEIRDCS